MLRGAIAVGMIFVLFGSAIGQEHQTIYGWTKVENMAGMFVLRNLKDGAVYSIYAVYLIWKMGRDFLAGKKFCHMQVGKDQSQVPQTVLMVNATSWRHCLELVQVCAAGRPSWNVQYSKRVNSRHTEICEAN